MAALLLRQAFSSWRDGRGVGLLAAAALAIGIGSATSIFTVVEAVMLRPLPYRDADRFVAVFSASLTDPDHYGTLSLGDVLTFQQRTRAFDAFGWFRHAGKNLMFDGQPFHVEGVGVTPSLAHEVGVEPVIGRWFQDPQSVTISSALWRRLGSDPAIVGKPLSLDGVVFTVAGVMPDLFGLPIVGMPPPGIRADVWMPLDPQGRGETGDGYFVYARRRAEVTFEAAKADLERVAAELAAEDPVGHRAFTARVYDLHETVVERVRPTLMLLLGAAGLLFLITCANTAGLLLARAVGRARETAVRVALGASRMQLSSYYFCESLVVSLAGGLGGVLLSIALTPAIVSMAADYLPRADEVAVNRAVLLFAVSVALLASALASLAPLWQATRMTPADALGEGVRASASARSRRIARALVIGEIALAFALLASSAVLVAHLRSLSRVAPGFDADDLLTFVVSIPHAIATEAPRRLAVHRALVESIGAVPGVDAVGFANQLPLDGCCMTAPVFPEGRQLDPDLPQRTSFLAFSEGFLRALRIPLKSGRRLTDDDVRDDHVLALVNDAAVQRYWNGDDPIGSFARFGSPTGRRFQVVGVVGDTRNDGLNSPAIPEVYVPSPIVQLETMHFAVRSARSDASLVDEIRRAVRTVDPELPIQDVITMRDIIARTMTLERVASYVTAFFAAAALVMATLGIYGVVSYTVRLRTVEIGTRMALGATRRDVLALVVRGGLAMAAIGVIIGGVAAIAGASYLSDAFRIGAVGAAPFLYSTVIVAVVAAGSASLPAFRATLVSPLVAIRNDVDSGWAALRQNVTYALRARSDVEAASSAAMSGLIDEIAIGVRRAASSRDAVHQAVAALGERIGATSIVLLEATSSGFRADSISIPARGFLPGRLRHFTRAVAISGADLEAWRRWARAYRPEHADELEALSARGVRLAAALRAKHEIVGILLLGGPIGGDAYTPAERQIVAGSADIIALLIENARLTEREIAQETLRRDLQLAGEVQRRLLPPQPPGSRAGTLAAFSMPARTVGGDYYDFVDLGGDRVGIAIADVSGKGIAAALLMSVVQASLRVISTEQAPSPAPLAAKMNAFLHQSTGANKYATFFYAEVEAAGRHLRYVNAGHNPPLLARRTGSGVDIVELGVGGTVLGLFPAMEYEEGSMALCPDDVLVAFTDGVPEALNAQGEEFGEDRVKALLREAAGGSAADVSTAFARAMKDWIGDGEQYDDLTVVVMAVSGGSGATASVSS
jgi:predicted permease